MGRERDKEYAAVSDDMVVGGPCQFANKGEAFGFGLFVLDVLTPGESWFVRFALPTALLVAVVGGGALGVVRGMKLSVFPTLSVGVIGVGVFLLGFEIVLWIALGLPSILSWSIVAFGGCLSIALLLWIINRRLRERHADYKRLFHL